MSDLCQIHSRFWGDDIHHRGSLKERNFGLIKSPSARKLTACESRSVSTQRLKNDTMSHINDAMSNRKSNSTLISKIPGPEFKPRKADRTRVEILQAALDFFWCHPFRELTVAGLMSGTSAGRSAFYRYFDDPYDLIEPLLRGYRR